MDKHRHLINACIKGNTEAFEQLYQLHAPKLMGVCLRYAQNSAEAQDLLQESFIKIFERLSSFKDKGSFEGWMHRITVNTALDDFRKKQKAIINPKVDYNDLPEDVITCEDILSQINHAELMALVQSLTPSYRIVFNLYVIEGFKHHEIAEQLNISEGTSKSNLSDARKILQKKIKAMMYENLDSE